MNIKMICLAVSLLLLATALTPAARAEETDIRLLARAIENAAYGESYTVMVSLASVLLNRIESEEYPTSIGAVISDAGIDVSAVTPSFQARRAAKDALLGFDPTAGAIRYSKEAAELPFIRLKTGAWCFY